MIVLIQIMLTLLRLLTAWKVFEKYNEPGWKGLIPFYSDFVECGKVWNTTAGILYVVVSIMSGVLSNSAQGTLISGLSGIVLFVLTVLLAINKSKAFDRGVGMAILLVIFPFIGNLIIGFGSARYVGNRSHSAW